jgi:hypothetical protein
MQYCILEEALKNIDSRCKMRRLGLLLGLLMVMVGNVYATPIPTSVKGTFSNGGLLIIKGSGFGTLGPNVAVFDNFSGTVGSGIPLTDPKVGSWSSQNNYNESTYSASGHSDNSGFHTVCDETHAVQLQKKFPDTTELFVSYWVRIPNGTNFPSATTPNTFSRISAWKLAWVMDGPQGYKGDDDICIPTWADGTYWYVAGNDGQFTPWKVGGVTDQWFDISKWNRITAWLKGGANPIVDNGYIWFQGFAEGQTPHVYTKSDVPIFHTNTGGNDINNNIPRWNQIGFPGWTRTTANCGPVYDDIYLATGPGAAARIEIGDNPDYAKSTKLVIVVPETWSDTEVSGRIYFKKDYILTPYLFVFDKDNNKNAVGYKLFPESPKGLTGH